MKIAFPILVQCPGSDSGSVLNGANPLPARREDRKEVRRRKRYTAGDAALQQYPRSAGTPTWFDWLPEKVQCLLLLLITLPATAILFFTGMHCVHTGQPIVLGNTRTDALEWFFFSVVMLVISGGIFAVLMGWAKRSTPHVSETHHRKL
jgi:hypothetical protein